MTAPPTVGRHLVDPIDQFRSEMRSVGITPPEKTVPDGKLRRFASNGRRNDDAGWYVLFGDGVMAGAFGDWRTGVQRNWHASVDRPLSAAEIDLHRQRISAMRRQREAEKRARACEAQTLAEAIWSSAPSAPPDHPYLVAKKVDSHGLRVKGDELLIPMRGPGNVLCSLQFIGPCGQKRFLVGGRVQGASFTIGFPTDPICISEGYATGASIYEATGNQVVVAFTAANLGEVALEVRKKFPEKRIILCADDDAGTYGNPGVTKAREAARANSGFLAVPDFGANRPEHVTDFNDLAIHCGHQAVRICVLAAISVETQSTRHRIEIARADSIKPTAVQWLFPNWLAQGTFHVLAGQAGTGKTTLAISLAATLSNGGQFPDGSRAPVGSTLMWSGEDNWNNSIVPRFIANGGDTERLHLIGRAQDAEGKPRPFDPATDFEELLEAVRQRTDLHLLLIDPVVSVVLGDSHKNAEVRRALHRLVGFAEETGIAILGITHFSKGTRGQDPVERVTGSLAFGAVPRVVMVTTRPTQQAGARRIILAKSNIGPDGGGFEFTLRQTLVDGYNAIHGQQVVWGARLEGTARSLLSEVETSETEGAAPTLDGAAGWLARLLSGGPMAVTDILALAEISGHAGRTLERAKKLLGIISEKSALQRGWIWSFPKTANVSEGRQSEPVAAFEDRHQSEVKPLDTGGGLVSSKDNCEVKVEI